MNSLLDFQLKQLLTHHSAFWGHSFVTELTRISAHSEQKFHKKAALAASSHVGEHLNGMSVEDKEKTSQ